MIIDYGAFYRKLTITLCVLAAIMIYIIIRFCIRNKRVRYINSLVATGRNPQLLIKEIEKDIQKLKSDEQKRRCIILKTTGMVMIGQWKEVVTVLNSFDPDILLKDWQISYYFNMISSLFLLGRIEEATEIILKNEELFKNYIEKEQFFIQIKLIYTMNDYYNNKIFESEIEFRKLLNKSKSIRTKAWICYYLVLINRNINNKEKAIEYIKIAKEHGKNTFIEEEVVKIKNNFKELKERKEHEQ